ncbi:MAG: hypothetical protein IH627_12385 [Rubrivivax sp.]|nr:hypothetical protein [Rubrivivax sp.]
MQPRFLAGLVDLPYVTPAGRVVTRPGWDPETQLYLALPIDSAPEVPEVPTRDQVQAAVVTMMRPWRAYGFADEHGAAAMVAAVIAAVVRPVMDLCPAFAFDAANFGAGKTKAAMALGALIEGQTPSVTAYAASSNDDELRKRMVSDALAGARFSCLDNVSGYLNSSALAAVLTTGRLSDRRLGVMEGVTARAGSLMTLTGANLSFSAELQRRIAHIRLDGGDRPTHRSFDFDPIHEALALRREVAVAVCTVLRAYFVAGAPDTVGGEDKIVGGDVGGFRDFNRLCRQAVLWLSSERLAGGLPWEMGDPSASQLSDPIALDPATAATHALLQALLDVSDGGDFAAHEVVRWCELGQTNSTSEHGRVRDAVRDVANGKDRPTAQTVGMVLAHRRERVAGGLKLLSRSGGGPVRSWRVVRV